MQKHTYNLSDPFTVKPNCQQTLKPEDPYNCSWVPSPCVTQEWDAALLPECSYCTNTCALLPNEHLSRLAMLVGLPEAYHVHSHKKKPYKPVKNCDTKI